MSNEDSKSVEISKLQKTVESLTLELDASKLEALNKSMALERQLDASDKEKSAFKREIVSMTELRNENAILKVNLCDMFNLLLFQAYQGFSCSSYLIICYL